PSPPGADVARETHSPRFVASGDTERQRRQSMSSRPPHTSGIEAQDDQRYDEIGEGDGQVSDRAGRFDGEIPRAETGYRIALTVLFAIIAGAIRTVLGLIVAFELLFTLITRRPPGLRVRALAN